MNIPKYPGYETRELPDEDQRIEDAKRLRDMGAVTVMCVFVRPDSDPHKMLGAELIISSIEAEKGDYVVGPYVACVESGDPFMPNGLCIWKLPPNET